MDERALLTILNTQGEDAGATFNDGDDVLGWFGWSIEGDTLTITHTDMDDVETSGRWRLAPQ
jgi:hypothetical protein